MNENNDLTGEKSSQEQDLSPVFLKSEELTNKTELIDYSKIYVLPTIRTRYFSVLIDVIVILLISLAISALFEKIGEVPGYIRAILFVIVVFLYEPILVAFGATIGQLILEIRVRKIGNPEKKLAFFQAVLRTLVKIILGWLSFITVTFNINRRAIHDFASRSIVISNKLDKE
jgi:uncharacterized RDD family membrane protein YckC